MEKREPTCTVGGNVSWYNHYGEQYEGSLTQKKKKKVELTYCPEVPLLGIYPEKIRFQEKHSPPQCSL